MSGRVSPAGLVKNPLVLATALGITMLSLGIKIPAVLKHPMSLVNSATFPLSMVVVGGGLSIGFLRDVRELGRNLSAVLLKLILSPVVAYLACLLLSLPLLETGVCMLQASMPTGVLVTVFSIKYKGDETLSNALISMSTLASIITIPAVTALAG